jgi:Domain of unknown function (DUF4913)
MTDLPQWITEAGHDDSKVYPTVEAWVTDYLAPIIQRPTTGRFWCPSWWTHPEAVWRLTALWQAWEALTTDGQTGPSSWWLHHLDPHLRFLFDRSGPFAGCRGGHTDLDPLPVTPRPPVWFVERDHD